jgi:hypothetical protein
MSRIDISTEELFLRLGSTPRLRSSRADSLFRRLRGDERSELMKAILRPPQAIEPKLITDQDRAEA